VHILQGLPPNAQDAALKAAALRSNLNFVNASKASDVHDVRGEAGFGTINARSRPLPPLFLSRISFQRSSLRGLRKDVIRGDLAEIGAKGRFERAVRIATTTEYSSTQNSSMFYFTARVKPVTRTDQMCVSTIFERRGMSGDSEGSRRNRCCCGNRAALA